MQIISFGANIYFRQKFKTAKIHSTYSKWIQIAAEVKLCHRGQFGPQRSELAAGGQTGGQTGQNWPQRPNCVANVNLGRSG